MKTTRLLTLFTALIIALSAYAYDFQSGDLYYNITSYTKPYTVEVTYQENYYVGNYSGLTTVAIPAEVSYGGQTCSVTSIGYCAFYNCSSLTSIIIPESVTSIGSGAFSNCSSLTSITIPESVTSIDAGAFEGTPWLSSKPDGLVYINNILYTYKGIMPANTSVMIADGTTAISASAFSNCSSLTSITIPESVTSIGSSAFANTGLTSITIPASVTSIGYQAFYNCSSLTSITIPASVTSIGYQAFYNCSSLTSIIIPESVTSIGSSAFANTGLVSLVFNADSCADFDSYDALFNGLTSLQSVKIGETVKRIPANFISGCSNVTSITIPESVTSIGSSAFANTGLTSIVIPPSVTAIGYCAFFKCVNLTSLIFNAESCADFNHIYYDNSLSGPFSALYSLQSVIIGGTVTHIPANFIRSCENVTSVTIPSSVTSIGDEAFCYCSGLTSITIPSSVTSIGDEAFYYCSGLTSITIPSSVTSIGEHAFDGCEQLTQLELPSIKTIAPYAFANCIRLSKAMFGQNLEEIGEYAFENCGKLIRITCYATIVPFCNENSFANYNGYLYVPCDLLPDYSADLLFGKFKYIQCIAAEPSTSTTEVTIVSGATDATFTWPVSDNTQSYTLEISKDGEVFCTLRFNGNGQLLGISFAPSNGTETQNTGAALTALGYQFSVTGLNSASLYTYELKALDASNNELASYAGQFSTDGYVGIGNVEFIEGVYAQNGAIVIDNDTNLPVAIYDVVGRLVVSGSSLTQYFEVPNAGVYIVKVGDQTMKVLVP